MQYLPSRHLDPSLVKNIRASSHVLITVTPLLIERTMLAGRKCYTSPPLYSGMILDRESYAMGFRAATLTINLIVACSPWNTPSSTASLSSIGLSG